MNLKKLLFLFSVSLFSLDIFSQSTPQVLSSAGLHLQNGNTFWDISIGETITTVISNINECATQGYLQPEVSSGTSSVPIDPQIKLSYYPNPFSDHLIIACERSDLFFSITDNTGRIVLQNCTSHLLNLSSLSTGLYHLLTYDYSGQLLSVNKICKSPF